MYYSSLLKSTPNQNRNTVTSLPQGLLLFTDAIYQSDAFSLSFGILGDQFFLFLKVVSV